MKNFLIIFILLVFGQVSQAQTELILRLNHRLDGKTFALNQEAISPLGTKYNLTRLQYYISGIKITHDGGQQMILKNIYLFVDPSKTLSKEFSLGLSSGITKLDSIEFAVGVDADANHLDPTLYLPNHPLAPKNPTMHWGWTSGYRFIALEGKAARSNGLFLDDIAIHSIGDLNFKTKMYIVDGTVSNGKFYIDMKAEYNLLLDGITIAGGENNHSETGSAAVLCSNASLKVFSPSITSSTKEVYNNSLSETIYGVDCVLVKYKFSDISDVYFKLYDAIGNAVMESKIAANEGIVTIDNQLISGNYFYSFMHGNEIVSTGKIAKR